MVKAHLRIRSLGRGIIRFEADCPASTTGLTRLPGPVQVGDAEMIRGVALLHGARCGECDVQEILIEAEQQRLASATSGRKN